MFGLQLPGQGKYQQLTAAFVRLLITSTAMANVRFVISLYTAVIYLKETILQKAWSISAALEFLSLTTLTPNK